jgi:starch synthase
MQILSVASEAYPLVKTGGLADVAGALPGALARTGVTVRTLLPGYDPVMTALEDAALVYEFADMLGEGPARLLAAHAAGLDLLVLDAPHLYRRAGGPYADASGRDWDDNAMRFACLAWAAAAVARGLLPGYRPAAVHAHDWQTGLVPAYLHYAGSGHVPSVMTVHNLAFQGQFPAALFSRLGLPPAAFSVDGVEYYGGVGFLKAGLQFADRITTVSPSYAAEILTDEGGMGLQGLLRLRRSSLRGILNGIDESVWDPARDAHLQARFTVSSLDRRAENKRWLKERYGLTSGSEAMLFGVVGRLAEQKGVRVLLESLPALLDAGADFVLLGSGDRALEQAMLSAAAAAPGRIGAVIGYEEPLAHAIYAGADALLVPSLFEPCGLTQLIAMHYGAVPVVSRVGGLNDTVIDANEMALAAGVATGLQFAPPNRAGLEYALARATTLWQSPATWRQLQVNGMTTDVGWDHPAEHYANLYREIVHDESAAGPQVLGARTAVG